MKHHLPAAAAILVLIGTFAAPATAQVLASNSFDADAQGWTSIGIDATGTFFPPPSLTWVAAAGNPGGAVRYDSPINPPYLAWFQSPANVVSALQSASGGTISWDLSTIHTPSAAFLIGNGRSDIRISGGGNIIRQIVTAPSGPPSYPVFAHYSLEFTTASGWFFNGLVTPASQAQIDAVLANADRMLIRADYWDRSSSTTAILDNVVISAPVPEPETYAMLIAGLALVGTVAARRGPGSPRKQAA